MTARCSQRVRLTEGLGSAWDANLDVAAWASRVNGLGNDRKHPLKPRPTGREQNNDSYRAVGQVLLVLEIAVRGDKDLEPGAFSSGNQFAVLQS